MPDSQQPPAAGRKAWNRCSLNASRRNRPCQHLDFRLGAFRTERRHLCCVKPPSVWLSSQQIQEANAGPVPESAYDGWPWTVCPLPVSCGPHPNPDSKEKAGESGLLQRSQTTWKSLFLQPVLAAVPSFCSQLTGHLHPLRLFMLVTILGGSQGREGQALQSTEGDTEVRGGEANCSESHGMAG